MKLLAPPPPPGGWGPPPDAAAIERLKAFALERWRERARERGEPEPDDLSSSCRFTSLLVQAIHGGEIQGNWDHFHVRLDDGTIADLNHEAADVSEIRKAGKDPYWHHRAFMRSRDVRELFDTCRPRVAAWIEAWRAIDGRS